MHKSEKYFDTEKIVDEALVAEPGFSLSDNFADMVAARVERKFAWQQYVKEFLVYLGAFAGVGTVWAAMSFVLFGAEWRVWLDFITSNIGMVGGIGIITVFVLFADRVLLRYFLFRSGAGTFWSRELL